MARAGAEGEEELKKNLTTPSQPGQAAQAMLQSGESPGFLSQNTWFPVHICYSVAEGFGGKLLQLSGLQSTHLQNLDVYLCFVKCKTLYPEAEVQRKENRF